MFELSIRLSFESGFGLDSENKRKQEYGWKFIPSNTNVRHVEDYEEI